MRLLLDEKHLSWKEAWSITTRSLALHQPHLAAEPENGALICSHPAAPPHGVDL